MPKSLAARSPDATSDMTVPDEPGIGVGRLARRLGLHASNVSTIVRGLVGRGLLAREPDPADRRAVRLQPTAQSVADLRMSEQNWAESFADTLATLTDDQRAALTAALPALRALTAAGQETPTAPGE